MNKSTLGIGILSLTAAMMLAAHWMLPTPAGAQVVAKERDYVIATAPVAAGGDAVYIVDNRTNEVAVFTYEQADRSLRVRAIRNLGDAFLFE